MEKVIDSGKLFNKMPVTKFLLSITLHRIICLFTIERQGRSTIALAVVVNICVDKYNPTHHGFARTKSYKPERHYWQIEFLCEEKPNKEGTLVSLNN